jgi:hypothetical protein
VPKDNPAGSALRWTINANDVLVSTCPEWDAFALANGGPEVVTARVLGRPLWSFLADPTTKHAYLRICDAARGGKRFSIPFRCDSPTRKRSLLLTVTPASAGGVAFASTLVSSEKRKGLPPPPPEIPSPDRYLVSCSWCNKLLAGDDWLELERAIPVLELFHAMPPAHLTHGICPACARRLETEIAALAAS